MKKTDHLFELEQLMRDTLILVCAALLAAGCGVNPDRMATLKERQAEMAEKSVEGDGEEEPMLEFDDNDPEEVRQAIMDLQDLQKLVNRKAYAEYLAKRYDLMKSVQFEASETVATSAKTPLIIDRVYALDMRVADAGGERAQQVVGTVGRVQMASADALYALRDGFEACIAAATAADKASMEDGVAKYQSALERARAVDEKALTFVGKKVTGGGYIDVPAEIAVCEARLAMKTADAADAPPAPEDLSKSYTGCGFYPVQLEAKQTGPNKFGDYLITSSYVADATPGNGNPVDCAQIPPVTDAPDAVQSVMKEFVAWLQPTDVISMAGNFTYENGADGQLTKQGTARVYRKQATLGTNKCGDEPGKVTCEAEGSQLATAINHAKHYMKRAEHYRGSGEPEKCKRMADMAFKSANISSAEDQSLQFLIASGQKLTHADAAAALNQFKAQGEQAMKGDWCAKP